MNNLIDLDLTNYKEHPTQPGYYVFRFPNHQQGEYFEELLKEEGIEYEKAVTEDERNLLLYAVHRKYLKRTEELNHKASAKFRKRFIPQRGLRIFLFALLSILILLAILGSIMNG